MGHDPLASAAASETVRVPEAAGPSRSKDPAAK
jgi:hypothetical protein